MTSTTNTRPDTSHQTPGADVTAIREGDRITIISEHEEYAILVQRVKEGDWSWGKVYVSGPELNARGKPYARGGRGLHLTGAAGGTWDWWRTRKPVQAERTGRHRLIYVEGDASGTHRTARDYNAKATVTVAPDASRKADLYQDPSIVFTVHPDGRWTLERRPPGTRVDPVLLASGHIDDPN